MSQRRERARVRRKLRRAEQIEVNVLPLMDVLFLLLAFFVVLTTSMVLQKGIAVNLAEASSGSDMRSPDEPITVSIDRSGAVFVNKAPTTLSELSAELQRVSQGGDPEKLMVILNADRDVAVHQTVAIIDEIRKSGLLSISIAVAPEAP